MEQFEQIKKRINEGVLNSRDVDLIINRIKDISLNKNEISNIIENKDIEDLLVYKFLLERLANTEEGHIMFSNKDCQKLNLNFSKIKKFLEEPEENKYVDEVHQEAFAGFVVIGIKDKSKLKEFIHRHILDIASKTE